MPSATLPSPPTAAAAVDTTDRLIFTVFLALAIHALLILGVTFTSGLAGKPSPTLEVTLAHHNSPQTPDKADFLAQFNQQGSGISDKTQQLTTEQPSPFASNNVNELSPLQVKEAKPVPSTQNRPITTTSTSNFRLPSKDTTPDEQPEKRDGKDAADRDFSAEIASLQAKVDQQRQAIAKRPRRLTLTSVATKASPDAAYLLKWTNKVEFVGNRNFPQEALRTGVFGNLRLLTILRPNGTIESVEILHSSGHSILDEAALQIVHLSAPFPPFPPEIRKNYDLMEIIRTWRFEINGLSTSSEP